MQSQKTLSHRHNAHSILIKNKPHSLVLSIQIETMQCHRRREPTLFVIHRVRNRFAADSITADALRHALPPFNGLRHELAEFMKSIKYSIDRFAAKFPTGSDFADRSVDLVQRPHKSQTSEQSVCHLIESQKRLLVLNRISPRVLVGGSHIIRK